MAGERTLPGLDLYGFWTLGSNGYRAQHSGNLRVLSALTQCRVISRTTSLPGSPTAGDCYIVPTGDANAEAIAIRDYDTDDATAIWVYLTPAEGYLVYVEDDNEYVSFNGTTWAALTASATLPTTTVDEKTAAYETVTADFDGFTVLNMNSGSALVLTIGAGETGTETLHGVQGGAGGVTITADAGVTLLPSSGLATSAQYALFSIVPWGTDTYLVKGEVA